MSTLDAKLAAARRENAALKDTVDTLTKIVEDIHERQNLTAEATAELKLQTLFLMHYIKFQVPRKSAIVASMNEPIASERMSALQFYALERDNFLVMLEKTMLANAAGDPHATETPVPPPTDDGARHEAGEAPEGAGDACEPSSGAGTLLTGRFN